MVRPRTGPFTLVAVLLAAGCGDRDGVATTVVTGITTNVTTLTPDTTSTSSSSTADTSTGASADESSSSSSSTTTTTTGSADPSSSSSTTTTEPDTSTGLDTTTGESYDPVQECLDMVDPGDECRACICSECLYLWEACYNDEGCTEIQLCAQKTGCYGPSSCLYDCEQTMLLWGPPYHSISFKLWEPLTMCLKDNCRLLCPW